MIMSLADSHDVHCHTDLLWARTRYTYSTCLQHIRQMAEAAIVEHIVWPKVTTPTQLVGRAVPTDFATDGLPRHAGLGVLGGGQSRLTSLGLTRGDYLGGPSIDGSVPSFVTLAARGSGAWRHKPGTEVDRTA